MVVVRDCSLSVIIPSFNRADALPETLASLVRQSLGPDYFEVILVDDGSTDGSRELVQGLHRQLPFCLKLIRQERQGPGAARNRGAQVAEHDLLLFWDSDMVAHPKALQVHIELHTQCNSALVAGGRRMWRAACTSTFAKVMSDGSLHKDYFYDRTPSFQDMLSCNLSIRSKDFKRLGGFDESLRAFEDLDLAYRAQQAGLSLVFAREAIGYHNHPMTLEQACTHQQRYQKHAAMFLRKHPELQGEIRYLTDKSPIRLGLDPPHLITRKILRQLIASRGVLRLLQGCVRLLEKHYPDPRILAFVYWKILTSYQLIGYREGLQEYTKEALS